MEDNIRGYKQRKYQLKGAGELIEVHGGHIVRSTAQKDRHSKVLTAKGPRDRRVRLSAHTAIQFYDVQDRLGCDRPSKAVDWLMQNAKSAIDQLGQPSPCSAPWDQHSAREPSMLEVKPDVPTSYGFDDRSSCAASFLPPLDAKASVKSFPVAAVIGSSHGNRTPDLLPSGGSRAQGLGLSLQSVHEPISRRAHHPPSRHPVSTTHAFYSESTSLAHSATPVGWPVHNEGMLSFNVTDALCGGGGGAGGAGGEFACNFAFSPHNQSHFTQRESLQSSSLSPDRAWMEPSSPIQQSSFSTAAAGTFTSGAFGGFSGFDMPARFQGEAQQGGISRKLHSASHQ